MDFLWGENLHLSGLGRGETAEVGGIFGDDLLRDCLVQRRVEGGVDAADSLVGKSFAILFLPEQTAILFKPGIELLDISGGKFVQWSGAQVWDDVLIDPPFIGHLGVGAKIWLFVGLIPEVQPLGGCHDLPGRLRLRSFLRGNQTFEFFLTFGLCFCQHIFSFGQSFVIVTDDYSALPTPVTSQVEATAAVLYLFSQFVLRYSPLRAKFSNNIVRPVVPIIQETLPKDKQPAVSCRNSHSAGFAEIKRQAGYDSSPPSLLEPSQNDVTL